MFVFSFAGSPVLHHGNKSSIQGAYNIISYLKDLVCNKCGLMVSWYHNSIRGKKYFAMRHTFSLANLPLHTSHWCYYSTGGEGLFKLCRKFWILPDWISDVGGPGFLNFFFFCFVVVFVTAQLSLVSHSVHWVFCIT